MLKCDYKQDLWEKKNKTLHFKLKFHHVGFRGSISRNGKCTHSFSKPLNRYQGAYPRALGKRRGPTYHILTLWGQFRVINQPVVWAPRGNVPTRKEHRMDQSGDWQYEVTALTTALLCCPKGNIHRWCSVLGFSFHEHLNATQGAGQNRKTCVNTCTWKPDGHRTY